MSHPMSWKMVFSLFGPELRCDGELVTQWQPVQHEAALAQRPKDRPRVVMRYSIHARK
jgi:hypothetical protein